MTVVSVSDIVHVPLRDIVHILEGSAEVPLPLTLIKATLLPSAEQVDPIALFQFQGYAKDQIHGGHHSLLSKEDTQ